MRKRSSREKSLNLPEGKVCGDCKNFTDCHLKGCATAKNQRCDFVPNNFALPGDRSVAEVYIEEYCRRYARNSEVSPCQQSA